MLNASKHTIVVTGSRKPELSMIECGRQMDAWLLHAVAGVNNCRWG